MRHQSILESWPVVQKFAFSPETSGGGGAAAAAAGQAPLTEEEARKRAVASKMIAASFGEVVSLMTRSERHAHLAVRDLEWLVAPAIVTRQFAIAEAQMKANGAVVPIGAVLWAFVSSEVDERLAADPSAPMKLAPAEWKSGSIPWIVDVLGDQRATNNILVNLANSVFKDNPPKVKIKNPDGKTVIGRLSPAAEKVAAG